METKSPIPETPARAVPRGLRRLVAGARIAAARLRFLAVFAAVFAIIGSWETIRTYSARLIRTTAPESGVSSDTEYFCPMDPGVVGDWPSKCPVCNMSLVVRKRGEAAALPEGVLARMQLTPYRLWLGGVAATPVDYEALSRTIDLPGVVVRPGRIEAAAFSRELEGVVSGQAAEVSPVGDRSVPPRSGRVAAVPAPDADRVATAILPIDLDAGAGGFPPGGRVAVRLRRPVEELEPFRSQPSRPPELVAGEPRRLFACMTHPDVVRAAPGACPRDQTELMGRTLRDNQRVRWWCPMHPEVTSERAGAKCDPCGGMILVPRLISYRLPGTVLAVPASAVIDDGTQSLVYVESGPGMFDARAVTLGPRCGAAFPVASGLQPGERVVAQGAFLVDAETRLNPSLAAGYFGAGVGGRAGEPAAPASSPASTPAWLEGLASDDRPRALRQKTCPVTGKPLGSMGTPGRLEVGGEVVFVCCDGCSPAIEAAPEKYLAKIRRAGAEP
ncbi:heavy metal-binding domain-containing protein [Paludisphaera soli]|uniref:heavy metal-binding domain-containing protein n=1 Tax=Paludisphaera soli TaxID=2712865 RepID=UPI0013EDF191|nr:heavy metal-binding domain-containing protein [Paludisphaera soli]